MQPTDKIMRQMIVEWLALAENDALDGARLSPLFFNLTDEGNHKRALNMIKWVIEDVMNWTPHEALNFIGKDFIDKMGLKICYEKIIFPLGYEKAKVRRTSYWEKSYTVRYIYIETDYGKVRLNCLTGYFEEDTPGIFDVIDLDYLTEYICERRNVPSIYDFIKLYGA